MILIDFMNCCDCIGWHNAKFLLGDQDELRKRMVLHFRTEYNSYLYPFSSTEMNKYHY